MFPVMLVKDRKPLCELPEIPDSLEAEVLQQVRDLEKCGKNDTGEDLMQACSCTHAGHFERNNRYTL